MKRTGSIGILICTSLALSAQSDGDHTITNNFGQTYMATDAIQTSTPANLTVGTTPNLNATLNVRGDQLPVTDPFFGGARLCTFRTDVAALREQSWWMYRDANHIGRIWADGGHRAFHFQNMEPSDIGQDRYSGAMVQNHQNDGFFSRPTSIDVTAS